LWRYAWETGANECGEGGDCEVLTVISGSLGEIEGTWSCVKDHEIPLKV